jgi:hypothetical protein
MMEIVARNAPAIPVRRPASMFTLESILNQETRKPGKEFS